MTPDFVIKEGDTLPQLAAILKIGGSPISDLSDVTNVKLTLVKRTNPSTYVFAADAVVDDVDTGRVVYAWAADDTSTIGAGVYNAEWHLTYSTGGKRTVPTSGQFIVEIEARNPETAPP